MSTRSTDTEATPADDALDDADGALETGEDGSRGGTRAVLVVGAALALVAVLVLTAVLSRPRVSGGPTAGTAAAPPRVLALAVPPGLPAVGSLVDARIGERGNISVVTWIRSSTPISSVRLAVPDVVGLPDGAHAGAVRVAGDRRFVAGPVTVDRTAHTYRFARPSRLVYVSYRLLDVTDPGPGVAGPVLLRATRLHLAYPADGPTRFTLHGARVLSAGCLRPGESVAFPCGTPGADGWRVELRGSDRAVEVQPQARVTPG